MKIKISELEKRLGYSIKKDFRVIGFDTAMICGIAFIRTDKIHAYLDWCYLEFQRENYNKTLKKMFKEFGMMLTTENLAVIEEVFVGFSRTGSLHLAKMGTMAIAQCIQKEIDFETILARSARAKFKIPTRKYGRGKSKLAVKDWLQNTVGIKISEDNCVDALVLAFCGICEGIDFTPMPAKKRKRKIQYEQYKAVNGNYTKINVKTKEIISHKKSKGPYKGIKIIGKT